MKYEQKVIKNFFSAIRTGNVEGYVNGDIYKYKYDRTGGNIVWLKE